MGKRIEKKILPEYYRHVRRREKTFELRADDTDWQVGDVLVLREWDGNKQEYTGCRVTREITYILRNCPEYGLKEGYCILAILPVGWNDPALHPSEFAVLDGEQT